MACARTAPCATPLSSFPDADMTRLFLIAASFALASLPATLAAQDPARAPAPAAAPATAAPGAAPALVGDLASGRSLTYTCQGCHGIEGYKNAYPNYHVPLIGGQSTQYLVNALTEYRKGTRKHPTMQVQAQSFSDQDIADIAAFLAGVTP